MEILQNYIYYDIKIDTRFPHRSYLSQRMMMSRNRRHVPRMLIAGLAIVIATLGLSACAESPRSTQGVSEVKEGRVRLLAGEVAIIDQRVNKRQKYWRFTYDGSNTVYMDRPDKWLAG